MQLQGPDAMVAQFDDIMKRRDELLRQRGEIDRQLKLIEDFIHLAQKLKVTHESPPLTEEAKVDLSKAQRGRNVLSPATITEYVREVLLDFGRPMKRGAILRELETRNVPVLGGDRAKVLGTMIWRARRKDGEPAFLNTPQGYWPSDHPLPE